MSHYPTSAELASFRRAIPRVKATYDGYALPAPMCGAYPIERAFGIGTHACVNFRLRHDPRVPECPALGTLPFARREASAMRSRAFAAHVATGPWPVGHGYEDGSRVCPIERSNGLPVEIGHYA